MSIRRLSIFTALLLTAGLLLLASLYPIQMAWGLNHLQFLPEFYMWGLVVVLVGLVLLIFTPFGNKRLPAAIARVDSTFLTGRILPCAGLLLVSAIIFYTLQMRTHFSGDGYTWLANFSHPGGYFWKPTEPGSIYLVRFIQSLLGGYTEDTALTAFRIVSIASGIIVVYNIINIARRLCQKQSLRVAALFSMLFSGGMLLFFGYVEFYPLLWAAGTTYLSLALKYLNEQSRTPYLMIVAFIVAVLVHLQALYLLPGLVYILFHRRLGRPLSVFRKKLTWSIAGVGVIAAVLVYFWLHENSLDFHGIFLHPFKGKPPSNDYAVFSPKHLIDIGNLLIVVFPGIIAGVVIWLFSLSGKPRTERTIFLTLTAICSLAFLFLIDPALGMARDWDLMSFTVFPLLLLVLHQIDRRDYTLDGKVIFSWLVVSLVITGTYIASNVATTAAENRFHTLLRYYGNKDRNGWVILTKYWDEKGVSARAMAVSDETKRLFPNFELLDLAEEHLLRGEIDKAEAIANRLVQSDPYRTEFIQFLGDVYLRSSRLPEAERCYQKALRLKPNNPPLNYGLGQVYIMQSRFREGLKALKSARRLDPSQDYITEALGLAYLKSGFADSASFIADTMLAADTCSPGGHLLKMMLSVDAGDRPSAQYHYQRYSDCGVGREEYDYMLQRYGFIMQ